jgi:hypothetical protein
MEKASLAHLQKLLQVKNGDAFVLFSANEAQKGVKKNKS